MLKLSFFFHSQAELVDALRKRRPRPDTSDEDLGLPRSPITPQRKENAINQSEGSLSLLSMVSSDMDDESSAGFGNSGAGDTSIHQISLTSSRFSSQNTSRSSDEVDLDMSITSNGSRLSHSAARHKMAVRPNKKKGPTRHRKPNEVCDLCSPFKTLVFNGFSIYRATLLFFHQLQK